MAREEVGKADAPEGFTVTSSFALSEMEKDYIRRVMKDQFPFSQCVVVDKRMKAEAAREVQQRGNAAYMHEARRRGGRA